ncbi:MAG: S9 family peptidase [Pseudomonadota bacterium]
MPARILAVACLVLLVAAPAHADLISDWAKEPEVLDAKISPQGDYLAVLKQQDGKRILVNLTYPALELASVMSFPGRNEVGSFSWVNDERLVASIWQDRSRSTEPEAYGELFAMNADGSKPVHLFGYRASQDAISTGRRTKVRTNERGSARLMSRMPGNKREILISIRNWDLGFDQTVEAAQLDVYTGRVRNRVRAPVPNAILIADLGGKVRFSYSTNDDQDTVIHIRDPKKRAWKVFSEAAYGESNIEPRGLAADGRLYVSYRPDDGPAGIYYMDPKTQQREEVFQNYLVDSFLESDQAGNAYAIYYMPDRLRYQVIDRKHPRAKLLKSLSKLFPEATPRITSSSLDQKVAVAFMQQPNKTPEFYLYDANKKQLAQLFDSQPWIDDGMLPEMRPIKVRARDGIELHGYLNVPAGHEAKDLPLIVVPHGGPHGPRDEWAFDWFAGIIPMHGYATLQLNYRGSGGYGTQFERSGFREWGKKMQDDLTDATRWAIDEGVADPDRLCIFGWSYGGYATLMGIIREPELYQCAAAGAGVYDQDVQYRKSDFAESTRWGKKYVDKVIGPTAEDRRAASPIAYVDRIKTPLILIHGREDLRVPEEHVDALLKAYRAAGKEAPEVLMLSRERHTPRKPENVEAMWRMILGFFREHIGPGVTVAASPAVSPDGVATGR